MVFTATITSQGQITIPAKARKQLGLSPSKKIIITLKDEALILQPEPDITKLSGILHKYAVKNKPIKEIIKQERKIIEEARSERANKKHF